MSRVAHHQPAYADLRGQFQPSYHLELVSDHQRVSAIRRALGETLRPHHVFCEVGCGTGIFALEAAQHCARVYAVELDPAMVEVARDNIAASPNWDRIELVAGDAMEVRLPERVDVAFCELMSIWAVEEPQITVANRVRRDLLKAGGTLLPLRIVNLAALGFYPFRARGVCMKAVAPLFTGISRPHIMTETRTTNILDFATFVAPEWSADVTFESLATGIINCVVLSSLVQMGPSTVFSGSDSLMPPTVVPLETEHEVVQGSTVQLHADLRARSLLDPASFRVVVDDATSRLG